MKYLMGFVQFWYDFIVGDDWRVALARDVPPSPPPIAVSRFDRAPPMRRIDRRRGRADRCYR